MSDFDDYDDYGTDGIDDLDDLNDIGGTDDLAVADDAADALSGAGDLPEPFSGEDVAPIKFGSEVAISGGSAVTAVPAEELIIGPDGTGHASPSEAVSGENPYRPV